MDIRLCANSKRILLLTVGYDGLRKGSYGVVGMGDFFNRTKLWKNAKLWLKSKLSISALQLWVNAKNLGLTSKHLISTLQKQIPTATKITSSHPF